MQRNNSVIVLDNHSAHHAAEVKTLARENGFLLLYTPPTCSDYNPSKYLRFVFDLNSFLVELLWSLFKREWRKVLWDKDAVVN